MYIGSFLKQLFKPKNIPNIIFLLLNFGLVFLIFTILPIEISGDENNPLWLGLIGLGIDFFFILISLTPFGEAVWRLSNGIKKQPVGANELWGFACSVFEEVKQKAIADGHKVSDKVRLYYSDDPDLNAFALGHRTVIITAGSLAVNDADFYRGIFAHEFGHIAHGDSDLKLGINVSNIIITAFMMVVMFVVGIISSILRTRESGLIRILGVVFHFLFYTLVLLLFRLWNFIGVLLVNWTSRKDEYAADKFAKDIGYGEHLKNTLRYIDSSPVKHSKLSVMFQTHPDTSDRIACLEA